MPAETGRKKGLNSPIGNFSLDKKTLESLYGKYNDRKYVHPDPLEFLYSYPFIREREVAGIIAASLAYGQVKQILKSVSTVLHFLGPHPADFLINSDIDILTAKFTSFKHRFTTGAELASFLYHIGLVLKKHGSLNKAFLRFYKKDREYITALLSFIRSIRPGKDNLYNSLIPMADGKCAYKRMNLFMRWMVRKDRVDPGGWENIPASALVVPVDIHMHRISLYYGLTSRKQADFKTAIEITQSFRKFDPRDPVKYDFALTREGMHRNLIFK